VGNEQIDELQSECQYEKESITERVEEEQEKSSRI
jgi:hypothetical protein